MHDSTRNMLDATANSGGLQRPPLQRVRKAGKVQEACASVESYGMCAPHTEKTHPATLQGRGKKTWKKARQIKKKRKRR